MSNKSEPKVFASTIRVWTPTWPSRKAYYWDLSRWGGGRVRCSGHGPGAVVLNDNGDMLNLQTGEVYYDNRMDGRIKSEALEKAFSS